MLKKIETKEEIKIFADYKISCIKFHQNYAHKITLHDKVVETYGYNQAVAHIGKTNYYQYLIIEDKDIVGMLECQVKKSDIDDRKYIYLKTIYIADQFRGRGLAQKTIEELKKKFDKRIELECWYGIPSKNLYEKMGMKELKTRYFY